MDEGIKNNFAEQSEVPSISKTEISEEGTIKTEILETRIRSSDFSNIETFSLTSTIVTDGSSKCLFEESFLPNPVIVETQSIVNSTRKVRFLESVVELAESVTEVEDFLESINLQAEETVEMLDMISRAKEKSESFIFQVEGFVKSLQEISKHSEANSKRGNTYLKSIYRKKLVEFASGLLDKVKKSIKDLEADYQILKEQEKKTTETFGKITEFHRISYHCTAEIVEKTVEKLKETVYYLAEELYLLKPKQLSEIEKVSYIETDIEMLYDLYRRFSSIEGSNLIGF